MFSDCTDTKFDKTSLGHMETCVLLLQTRKTDIRGLYGMLRLRQYDDVEMVRFDPCAIEINVSSPSAPIIRENPKLIKVINCGSTITGITLLPNQVGLEGSISECFRR